MNRVQLTLAALLGALMPLVFDSALKGAALLAAAALCALVLYRASAATRHLVWLVAVVALLIVPVLSFALPQWRILPQWTAVETGTGRTKRTEGTPPYAHATPGIAQMPPPALPPEEGPLRNEAPALSPAPQYSAVLPVPEVLFIPQVPSTVPWLPLAWAAGFGLLALRLLAAHLMLRRAARRCTALTAPPDGFIAAAFTVACTQLSIRRRVTLLLDEKRTIPVVWGVFHPRLLLPAEAREWNEEQLRSVLLHELAHIRRRDALVQWITQIACALHWFNPLVWLAAWRLHAERERACDDLVLASGVRPSAYAEHLLHVATKLSPARWTAACGLAMARKSSLEGRLLAVLSGGRNRRGVTRILVAAAVILAAAVAIPLAMLRAAGPDKSKADAPAVNVEPKDARSKALFENWKGRARADGKIPGGLIGRLGAKVEEFVRINRDDASGAPYAKRVEPILPRFDASRDWSPDEAVKLLNDLAALSDIPISNTLEADDQSRLYPGKPLPAELKDAPWGEPSPEGLRVARPLDPSADSYPTGTALRSRILLHNVGKELVLLRTKSWMQPGYEARDATGNAVNVESTYWTTLGQIRTSRLAPGEYMEILTPGLGVGKGAGKDEWADVRVGSWLDATGPADIILLPGAVSVSVDDSRGAHIKTGEQLKLEVIREWLDRESPMPASAADREKIVSRVTKDIFGVDPTADEIAAFVSSKSNDPISALANRLLERAGLRSFVGEVKPGEIKFRTTPADPDAANRPRVAIGAGRYTIGNNARLIIVQGARTDAEIRFWAADQKSEPPGKPHKIEVPDGWGTWAITCRPGTGILYVLTKGAVRKIDYSNPAQVKETPVTRGSAEDMPDEFREAVKRILTISGVPDEQITALIAANAKRPKLPDEAYTRTGIHCQKFREEDAKCPGGELMGDARWEPGVAGRAEEPLVLGLRVATDANWTIGGQARVQLVVRATGASDVKFPQTPRSDNGLSVVAIDKDGKEHVAEIAQFDSWLTFNHLLLPPAHVVMVKAFTLRFDPDKRGVSEPGVAAFHLPPGDYKLRCKWNDARPEVAHEGEWTGELVSVDHKFTLTAAGAAASDTPKAGAQIKPNTEQKLKWGEAANGLRMALAWPPTLGEPGMGDAPEFYLVVQNVSETPVRLAAGDDAPNPRKLMMRENGRPLQAISDPVPAPGDWLLEPREVAFLRLYQSNADFKDGRTISSAIEQDIRTVPRYSMTAEMTIEKAPAGAWTGKLITGQTRGSVDVIPPKHKDAQALYISWTTASRTDGKIPGALIGRLAESVKTFIKGNPTWETTPQLEKMLPRFDATRDWSGPDAVALLDELTALQSTPVSMALDHEDEGVIRTGTPLPAELANAPWGEALSNGLRHAWLLEPCAAGHRLGTPLKARVLIHNAGKEPVVFRTRSWHQLGHKATDAKGADIKLESTQWTTIGRLTPYRLAPGEFIEVNAAGIGVGPVGNHEDWQHTRVGTWIEARAGDDVTVTTEPVPLHDWNDQPDVLDGEPRWWLDHISARLSRHQPFPADADARIRLLHHVAIEVLGTSVGKEMNDAFVADTTPTALDAAATRLFHRPGLHAWAGPLVSGPTKFRVLAADPDAAKKPRTASNPGEYTLGGNATLKVTRRGDGERIVNDAEIRFAQPEPEAVRPPGPFKLKLPDGYNTWAAAWIRGGTVMWVTEKGLLRRIDFSKIAKVEETRYEADSKPDAPIPPDIREALGVALNVPDAPKQQYVPLNPPPADTAPASEAPKTERPKDGADAKLPDAGAKRKLPPVDGAPVNPRLADDRYAKSGVPLAEQTWPMPPWGAEKEGLSTGIRVIGDARTGGEVKVELWVRNSGAKDVKFSQNSRADVGLSVVAKDKDGKEHHADITRFSAFPIFHHLLLPPGHGVKVKEFKVKFGAEKNDKLERGWVNLQLTPGDYKLHAKWSDSHALVTHADDWTGELTSGEVDVTVVGADAPNSEKSKQGAKLNPGTEEKLEWGEPVNGLRIALAWPPTLGEPAAGEVPDFFLAVQNVSEAAVRLCTTAEAPNERRLTFSTDGRIQSRSLSSEPNGGDATLGPREVVFLRLFMESAKDPEEVPHGSMIASAVRQGPGVRLLADMEITKAPAGAWTGTLATPWTRAGIGVEAPKNRKAQELFKVWLQHTRVNGKVPGGHIARLGDRVKEFVRANTGDKSGEPFAKRMEPLVSRLDGARDWQPAEASALLNDIAAVSDVPLSVMLEETAGGTIQYSLSLKPELENAPWGEALPNGLRVACLLEPRAAEHRLGTPLKMRILVHNAGKEPVVIRTRTWHHIEPTARDAKGAEIKMESVTRYTRPPLVAYRLMPGRFIELASPGLGIGRYGFHDFKDADIASWIGAKEGDEVTLAPGPVPLSDWNEASVLNGEPRWWLDFITARLSLANPLPADAAERTQLLKSTMRELFHNDATPEEIAAFVADRDPNALDSLAKSLAHRPGLNAWAGSLTSGTTKFRVTAADPGGAKPAAKPATPAPR